VTNDENSRRFTPSWSNRNALALCVAIEKDGQPITAQAFVDYSGYGLTWSRTKQRDLAAAGWLRRVPGSPAQYALTDQGRAMALPKHESSSRRTGIENVTRAMLKAVEAALNNATPTPDTDLAQRVARIHALAGDDHCLLLPFSIAEIGLYGLTLTYLPDGRQWAATFDLDIRDRVGDPAGRTDDVWVDEVRGSSDELPIPWYEPRCASKMLTLGRAEIAEEAIRIALEQAEQIIAKAVAGDMSTPLN
jgi:hypothetical protein